MSLVVSIINLIFFLSTMAFLVYLNIKKISFSIQSLIALFLGILVGLFFYFTHITCPDTTLSCFLLETYRVISDIYISLLKAMIYPLIIVAILVSFTKINSLNELSKYGLLIIFILLIGLALASLISMGVAYIYGLTNDVVLPINTLHTLTHYTKDLPQNIGDMIINFFPFNPFLDFTGARKSSTIATVVFTTLIGIGYLTSRKQFPKETEFFKALVNSLYIIITKVLSIIIRLTPYAIFALMIKAIITTKLESIVTIFNFTICVLIALFIVFIIQLFFIYIFKFNPFIYLKKTFTLLSFAFFSRSSSASIPLSIYTQTQKLGINSTIANFSTTLGSVIGQVGCVGVYVTMLVLVTAAATGEDLWNFNFIIYTIFIVVITSFGIGGVGGGAIYGAIVALSLLNFPLTILGLLIPAEAILDMFRTLLNVNGSTTAGLITSKITKTNNKEVYNNLEKL